MDTAVCITAHSCVSRVWSLSHSLSLSAICTLAEVMSREVPGGSSPFCTSETVKNSVTSSTLSSVIEMLKQRLASEGVNEKD